MRIAIPFARAGRQGTSQLRDRESSLNVTTERHRHKKKGKAMAATAYGGTIGFMGAGAMAEALARGFVRNNMAQFGAMHFTDPSPERQEAFSKLGANRCEDNDEVRPAFRSSPASFSLSFPSLN